MESRGELGRRGERLAEEHLVRAGMEVLARNWRCSFGEIDLVARDGDCLVVCEVKTRSSERFGAPAEAVTRAKLTRLHKLRWAWITQHGTWFPDSRVDVVAIVSPPDGPVVLEHLVRVG